MVIDRLGVIEAAWCRHRLRGEDRAKALALFRIALLQRSLRARILDVRTPLQLNRRDPLGEGRDFRLLDQMAETLWLAASRDQAALASSDALDQAANSDLARLV